MSQVQEQNIGKRPRGRPKTGRGDPNERVVQIQHLWDKHREVLRLIALGHGNKDIGQICGYSPQTIANIRNSPICRQHLEVLQAARDSTTVDVARVLLEDAPKSLQLLQEVRDGEHGAAVATRAQVAQDLLSRAGFPKITKLEGNVSHGIVTEEILERVKARRAGNGAVEAEFTEGSPEPTTAIAVGE